MSDNDVKQPMNVPYRFLRQMVGVLGMSLPIILYLGRRLIFQEPLLGSISQYYHSGMGDVFVGVLCATGFFLYAYRGYPGEWDIYFARFGALLALGTALFPTSAEDIIVTGNPEIEQYVVRALPQFVGRLHLLFAAGFFIVLAIFCLHFFTKTADPDQMTDMKKRRNRLYKICGWTIIVCILLIGAIFFFELDTSSSSMVAAFTPVFWLEAIALEAFAISWLVKGEAFMQDQA